jgi:hypothetical protein
MLRTALLSLTAVALVAADAPAAPAKPYPLDTCIVSDQPLGSMGGAATLVHEGQEVKFCCGGCTRAFKRDPAKFLAKIPAGGSATAPAPAKP